MYTDRQKNATLEEKSLSSKSVIVVEVNLMQITIKTVYVHH